MHTEQWFKNRIGKLIHQTTKNGGRDKEHCCKTCRDVYENGIVIRDTSHADYLYIVQCEMGMRYK